MDDGSETVASVGNKSTSPHYILKELSFAWTLFAYPGLYRSTKILNHH